MGKEGKRDTERRFTISELADEFDISSRTIRFYEEKGLISPGRTPGNRRFYTGEDRTRLKLILRGKRFGFSLEEIAEMIGMSDTRREEVSQIEKSLAFGRAKLKEIRTRREDLELLEQDLLATRDKLVKRLRELKGKKPY